MRDGGELGAAGESVDDVHAQALIGAAKWVKANELPVEIGERAHELSAVVVVEELDAGSKGMKELLEMQGGHGSWRTEPGSGLLVATGDAEADSAPIDALGIEDLSTVQ
jgi:hypothetical protein